MKKIKCSPVAGLSEPSERRERRTLKGKALVTRQPITFLGGVDAEKGIITEKGHELEGRKIKGKVLIFPRSKGSTVGSYSIYALAKNRAAPLAMIVGEVDATLAAGAIIAGIPLVHAKDKSIFKIKEGEEVIVELGKKAGYVYARSC